MSELMDVRADEQIIDSSNSVIPWRQINFISPNQQLAQSRWLYQKPLSFSAKGMDHLYLLNQFVIRWLQPPGVPPSIIKKELLENPEYVLRANKVKLLSHFWGMILASTIALCFAVIVPLLGLLLCCCWCSPSSSSKRAKSSSRGRESPLYANAATSDSPRAARKKKSKYKVERGCDPFWRSFCGANLFIFLLFISFFVICAFVTNEYIQNGLHDLPKTLNQSLDDFQLYLNNTQFEVNTLLRTNFRQLEQELDNSLDKSGLIVKNRLAFVSQAIALENLTEIVTKLDNIHGDLVNLSKETDELRSQLHMLQSGLRQTKQKLESVFKECTHPICTNLDRKFKHLKAKFRVSTRLDDLPDLSPLMQNITALLNANIVDEVQRGKGDFDRLSSKIQSAVNDSIPEIKRQIRAVGRELAATARDVNEALRTPFGDIRKAKESVNIGSHYIEKYEIYRWYACLGGASAILIILALYTCGLMCGVCKSQPTVQEYRNRRIKPPSTCPLKCGIILLFMFFGALLLCTIVLFIFGGLFDRVGCYYLENPSDEQAKKLMGILQTIFEKYRVSSMNIIYGSKPNFAEVLSRCHQNMSLYNSLQLYKFNRIQLTADRVVEGFNISDILEFKGRYKIEDRLRTFLAQVDVNPGPIVILTPEGRELLDRLKETSLGTLNFSSFAELIHQQVTPLNLIEFSQELDREAKYLPPSQMDFRSDLKNAALLLDTYQSKVISRVHDIVVNLKTKAEQIEKKAKYGHKGLKEALSELLEQAKKAQHTIRHEGKEIIKKVARQFVSDLSDLIDQYAKHVIFQVENNIGRCEPVSRAVNASIVVFCNEIILPFNGYWLSMASALFLLLPATICAAVLSNLFRKLKRGKGRRQYSGDSSDVALETFDEDDIPLAQVANKEISNPYDVRRNPPTGLFLDGTSSAPSAPLASNDETWSPGAPPPHIYSRPPPYNFAN
ncbi:prominin-like protein [Dinothrombium tinctorium]|uniref:Prominin-like protein n=1 Tax=Dinothrombium tinctorium TaxID=1965070 RepID=A0A3S3PLD2_9ACAR|nr:prominin-like protein [Dinothrombium tinctorium]RWS14974.1 prominin-like protein [Dinothrombium tinctorium]